MTAPDRPSAEQVARPKQFVAYGPGYSGDFDTISDAANVVVSHDHQGAVYERCDVPREAALMAQVSVLRDAATATADAATAFVERIVAKPYAERNMLVGALSKMFPSWINQDPSEPDWPVILIQLPTGQVSWHITALERYGVFAHVYAENGPAWDGHDDVEKWRRVSLLADLRGRA